MLKLKKLEYLLLAVLMALLLLGIFGPFVAQPTHQHDFADQRAWGAIPFALDVVSNLPFALWGAFGLGCALPLAWSKKGSPGQSQTMIEPALAALFFAGLLATTAASSWYHWLPNNSGLAVDRLGMTIAFSGLLGLSAAGRVSLRAGVGLAGAVLVSGLLSVQVWVATGNILPWALVQFGGMAMVVWFAALKPLPGALPVRWGVVIIIYALAKLLEMGDHQIYDVTSHLVSGHSLKHVVASFAAWPVLAGLGVRAKAGPGTAATRQKFHKTSAECPSPLQGAASKLVAGKLRAPQRSGVFKTKQNRSQA